MASGRMLQRKISKNEALALVVQRLDEQMGAGHGAYAALLFTWAIAHQDVEGRMEGDPRVVRANVFPMLEWVTSAHVERYLVELGEQRLIVWYEAAGKRWLFFPGFAGAQPGLRRDREAPSSFPPPEQGRILAGAMPDKVPDNSGSNSGGTPGSCPATAEVTPPLKSEERSKNTEIPPPARARVDASRLSSSWSKATGTLMASGMSDVAMLCEDAAAAQEPPVDPTEYAERAIPTYVTWALSCPPGKRPGLNAMKFREHFERVQRIMRGLEPPTWQADEPRGRSPPPDERRPKLKPMSAHLEKLGKEP